MGKSVQDYLDLVTSEHSNKPKFMATVALNVAVPVQVQSLYTQMIPLFDVEVAVGDQQDILGQWIGVSRQVKVPITGVYFTWDGITSDGWDFGIWQGPNDPDSGLQNMPDDVYRQIQLGKIAANHWDGTTPDAYKVLAIAFPALDFAIQDNQDMSMVIGVSGAPLSSLTKALIIGGYIPLKPEGVRISYTFVTVDAPLFGWDLENSSISGWDTGAWGEEF